MGKGDRKTAKGKRYNSSYGNARSHATTKVDGTAAAPVAKKTATKSKPTSAATAAPRSWWARRSPAGETKFFS